MDFSTAKARKIHETGCFIQHISSTTCLNYPIASSSSMPIYYDTSQSNTSSSINADSNVVLKSVEDVDKIADASFVDGVDEVFVEDIPDDNDEESEDSFEDRIDFDVPMFEERIHNLIKIIEEIVNQLSDNVKQLLRLFYQNRVTLSIADVISQPSAKSSGIQVYVPSAFRNTNRKNEVSNAHKKISYHVNKHINLISCLNVRVGPFFSNNKDIYLNSTVAFRPLEGLLMSFLQDNELWSLGTYCVQPLQLKDFQFCCSYAHSRHYKRAYESITKQHGADAIPLPLLLWSDGATYIRWSKNGSAHTIVLISLLHSVYQMTHQCRGPRLCAFSVHDDMTNDVPSDIKSHMRTMSKARCVRSIMEQIVSIGKEGLKANKRVFIPYVAAVTADLVEMRSLTATSHCPVCDQQKGIDLSINEFGEYNGHGIKLSQDIKEKVYTFEQFQMLCAQNGFNKSEQNKIEEYSKQMIKYSQDNHRKMVINAFECIEYPSFMEHGPMLYIDRLHCLLLNEVRYFLQYLFKIISKDCFHHLTEKAKHYKYFPKGFISLELTNLTGSQIARGALMVVSLFYDHSVPVGFDSLQQMRSNMLVLDSFCLLIALSCKEEITKKANDDDKSIRDLDILNDVINCLRISEYFKHCNRDNAHVFLAHFCDLRMWHEFGLPRYLSSSFGESCLSQIKSSLHACNKRSRWREDILGRVAIADIYLPTTSTDLKFDGFMKPKYAKVCKVNRVSIEIGYIDQVRGNQYNKSKFVVFETYTKKNSHYCIAVKSPNQCMLIEEILNLDNNEKGTFLFVDNVRIFFKGRVLGDIPDEILQSYRRDNRGISHPSLWTYLSPSKSEQWHIDEVIGGSFHREVLGLDVIALLNYEHSHIITGNESIVKVPDIRFA